ncbi:MAG: DNA internalization-related competence protein ComEC/Rec2 [Methylovulum sp.]|nr:DNA internalization-related competence protein ComEC/Rec2 [Methylovulum sp.]
MILSALAFLAGILLVQQFATLPDVLWLLALAAGAGLMVWLRYWRGLFFVIGVVWVIVFAAARLADRLPEQLAGVDVQVGGVVGNLPEQDDRRIRFDFVVKESTQPLPSKLRLNWYYPNTDVKAGQHWTFTTRLKPPHGSLNPGGFDYERWLFTEGIGATGYVRSFPKPVLTGQKTFWTSIAVWRQTISDRLPNGGKHGGLLKALVIGDGSGITPHQWEVFRKTGTTHLVVISGSHIALVAGLVYLLTRRLWAWIGCLAYPPQQVAAFAAMLAGIFYAGLAGFSVPTQRAVVMLTVLMFAVIRQRHLQPFNTLAVALVAVLALEPTAVLAAGFWLSFLAVAIIVYAVAGRLGRSGPIAEAIKINWVTSLGLSPLLLFFFQQISLCAPLANFIAVPVISLLVVPGALLAVLLMLVWQAAAAPLFVLLDLVLQALYELLAYLARLPFATLNHPQPPYWALGFAVPGMLILLAPRGWPARWAGLVLLLPLMFNEDKKPALGDLNLTVLDVGQGLAVAVQTAGHWLVYDTGAKFSAESDMGQSVLLPFLHEHGVAKLDRLVISHGDNDHIGGAASLLQAMPTDLVLTSVPEQLQGFAPVRCRAGQSWQWDHVNFTLLSPPSGSAVSDNDHSCVLKIEAAHASVLLTGDIEAGAEAGLLKTYRSQLKADVLIAPHHGSHTSSTQPFLQAVKPDTVVISAGYRNPFGHPHKEVLNRYRQLKAHSFNTADNGAITLQTENNAITVHTQREIDARYWHNGRTDFYISEQENNNVNIYGNR